MHPYTSIFINLLFIFPLLLGWSCVSIYGQECSNCSEQEKIRVFQPVSLEKAITETIHQQLEIKFAKWNIYFQQGVIQTAAGPFDPVINDVFENTKTTDAQNLQANIKSDLNARLVSNVFTFEKRTRLGTLFTTRVDAAKVHNELAYTLGLIPDPHVSTGNVVIRVEQALLRGAFGEGLDAQREIAAKRELDAVKYDFLQTISQKVLDTVLGYWDFVGSIRALQIHLDTEKKFVDLEKKARFLAEQQEIAPADILQIQASLAIKRQTREAAVFRVYATMKQLLFDMGDISPEWSVEDCCFDQVVDVFPEYAPILDPSDLSRVYCCLVTRALEERFDIQAAAIREEVANTLLVGLANEQLPQFNVFGQVQRSDFKVGRKARGLFSALHMDHPQKDWTVGVSVSVPVYNDAAIGAYNQQYAIYNQRVIQTRFIKEQTIRDILVTLKNLTTLVQRIEEASLAVKTYQKVVENEFEKFKGGFGSVFNLIDFENRLSESRLLENALYADWSQEIARLRFYTGTLLKMQDYFDIAFESPATFPLLPTNDQKIRWRDGWMPSRKKQIPCRNFNPS